MGTKEKPSAYDCIAKAAPDEPYFALIARDPLARGLVQLWAALKEKSGVAASTAFAELMATTAGQEVEDEAKTAEARQCARDMLQWSINHAGAAAMASERAQSRADGS